MATKVLVVGSGVIGLRTALELLHRGVRVHLVSPCHPIHPTTCSMGAGGFWMPFRCDDTRVDRWAFETLHELTGFLSSSSSSSTTTSGGSAVAPMKKLVEQMPAIVLNKDTQPPPSWSTDRSLKFESLSIDDLYARSISQRFRLPMKEVIMGAGYSQAFLYQTRVVDAPNMLMHLLDEITNHENTDHVDVETNKYYTTLEEVVDDAKQLGCDGVVNCTGLGSNALCNDTSIVGARGILLHYDRESIAWHIPSDVDKQNKLQDAVVTISDPPFGTDTAPCYMIPRGDIIAMGGSVGMDDKEKTIRPEERERILQNAHNMGIDTTKSAPISEWVGWRPYRPTARLEVDAELSSSSGVTVVHSYGYGGSGWTVFAGVASDSADLLLEPRLKKAFPF